jgi:hypothetical protein
MVGGRPTAGAPMLADARKHCAQALQTLPDALRRLEPATTPCEVGFSDRFHALVRAVEARPT